MTSATSLISWIEPVVILLYHQASGSAVPSPLSIANLQHLNLISRVRDRRECWKPYVLFYPVLLHNYAPYTSLRSKYLQPEQPCG